MNWEDYKAEFDFDGSWRDIYVLSTSAEDWQRTIDFIRSDVYSYKCYVGGEESNLASSAIKIFEVAYELKPFVSIKIGSTKLNCHFFGPDEIEFDLDPREIQTQVEAEQVFDFMRQLGRRVNKEVILTPENSPQDPIFKFSPGEENLQYVPFGGV